MKVAAVVRIAHQFLTKVVCGFKLYPIKMLTSEQVQRSFHSQHGSGGFLSGHALLNALLPEHPPVPLMGGTGVLAPRKQINVFPDAYLTGYLILLQPILDVSF